MAADLHTHTFYSDGRSSPEALLAAAKRRGLRTLAITDHDTTRGNREGQGSAKRLGLELIPAAEFTSYWPGYTGHGGGPDIDVLGYFLELDSPRLAQAEVRLAEAQRARAESICAALARAGYRLGYQDLCETSARFQGFLTIRDSLQRLHKLELAEAVALLEPAWQQAEPAALSIDEAIALIHEVGGVAVLAHPSIIHRQRDGEPLSERGMADLVEMGLDGVEVLHYRLSARQRQHFALLARMFELPISGGSDEHGGPEQFPRLGQEAVTSDMVAALRERRRQRA